MVSLKKLALRKAKAEIQEIKERVAAKRNPFSALLELTDRLPKIVDVAIYAGLAYQSFMVFGRSETEELDRVKTAYTVNIPTGSPIGSIQSFGMREEEGDNIHFTTKSQSFTAYKSETKIVKRTHYNPAAALIGPVGLKLAQADNLVSGSVGCGILAALGIGSVKGILPDSVANLRDVGLPLLATTLPALGPRLAGLPESLTPLLP